MIGRFDEPLTDTAGNALVGASVLVTHPDGSVAPLFTAEDGLTAAANPVNYGPPALGQTGLDGRGNFVFHARVEAPGPYYDLTVTPAGALAQAPVRVRVTGVADVAALDALGLATQAELDAHAAGSSHAGYVDLTSAQTITGAKTFDTPVDEIMRLLSGGVGARFYDDSDVGGGFHFARHGVSAGLAIEGFASISLMGGALYPAAQDWNGSATHAAAASGQIPLIVKGATSQTGDLQQWQNSAGTVLASVSATGSFDVSTTQRYSLGGSRLFERVGTTLYAAEGFGEVWFRNTAGIIVGAATAPLAQMDVRARSATTIGQIIRGFASQSNDLQQWQNSAGAVLARVGSTGDIASQNNVALLLGDTSGAALGYYTKFSTGHASRTPVVVQGLASQTADLQQWQNSAGAVLAKVAADGFVYASGNAQVAASLGVGGVAAYGYSAALSVLAPSATAKGVAVRGAASQTGDLQQWQDSTGGVLAKVGSTGLITTAAYVATPNLDSYVLRTDSSINNRFRAASASHNPLIIQGAASQTADLQQWQNSAGSVLARVGSDGTTYVPSLSNTASYTNAFIVPSVTGTVITTAVAANKALVVRNDNAAATADLQQWQDSTGLAKTGIAAGGYLVVGAAGSAFLGMATILTDHAFRTPLVLRGFASQSNDLQQWQNSAGAVLAKVSATGNITTEGELNTPSINDTTKTGPYASLTTASVFIFARGAGNVPLSLRGATSQTADLQQWQDSTGAVMARVTPSGSLGIRTADFAGGAGVIAIANRAVAPSTTPVGGGVLFASAGALVWRGSAGTTTTIAVA